MTAQVDVEDAADRWYRERGGPQEGNKEPPWSREAEQHVLGALLLDNASIPLVTDKLIERSFYQLQHQAIYGAICKLHEAGQPADPLTVFDELQSAGEADECGGLVYLNGLSSAVLSSANVRRYAEIVADRWEERELIAAAADAQHLAWDAGIDFSTRVERMVARLQQVQQQRKNPGARVPMLRLGELRESASRIRWLVKHVVPADSIGMLFGGSGTFKSFIALDCALHVAHGLPWMGRRTDAGAVLYIAAEGGAGLWNRIDAWHRARRLRTEHVPMVVVPVPLDLTVDAWRVVQRAQAMGITPTMVVVDTLSQTYAGDENSANEMAAYLRELGQRFRALWQCAVLLIHHTGHNATERPRGTSALRANVDFMFGVFRDEKEMLATLSCVKQKDGELFRDAIFGMSVGDLGFDEDNDAVTSLVAKHLGTEAEVADAREREVEAGRGGRNVRLMSLVTNGMSIKELRKAFYEDVVDGLDADAKKKAFYRARDSAVSAGLIEVVEGLVIDLRKGK